MIISCVTITTSVIEVILLVVTCFYYRQRIDWLVERHKETATEIIRRPKRETVPKARESVIISIFRYVMDPTSIRKQSEESPYDYANNDEVYIQMNATENTPENYEDSSLTQTDLPDNRERSSNVPNEPPVSNTSDRNEENKAVNMPPKPRRKGYKRGKNLGGKGNTCVHENTESLSKKETVEKQFLPQKLKHNDTADEKETKDDLSEDTYVHDTAVYSNVKSTGTTKMSDNSVSKEQNGKTKKSTEKKLKTKTVQVCNRPNEQKKSNKHVHLPTASARPKETDHQFDDNYSEFSKLSSDNEGNDIDIRVISAKESSDLDQSNYVNVKGNTIHSDIGSSDITTETRVSNETVGETESDQSEKRESSGSGLSGDSHSSEVSTYDQAKASHAQPNTNNYVNCTLHVHGDVFLGQTVLRKTKVDIRQ